MIVSKNTNYNFLGESKNKRRHGLLSKEKKLKNEGALLLLQKIKNYSLKMALLEISALLIRKYNNEIHFKNNWIFFSFILYYQ